MNGTEWTEPGMGVTAAKLYDFVGRFVRSLRPGSDMPVASAAAHHLSDLCNSAPDRATRLANWNHRRTNLRLTGGRPTIEDLRRIAEAR